MYQYPTSLSEAIAYQSIPGLPAMSPKPSGLDLIDRIPFETPGVLWLIMAENSYLDDYEESVTLYGLNTAGKWVAVSGSHCSCYGWEEMDLTPEEYPSFEILLAADKHAEVIVKHWATLLLHYPFLHSYR